MPKNKQSDADLRKIAAWLLNVQAEMVASLREMVLRESPTHNKQDCDALCAHLADEFASLGGEVKIHKQRSAGDHLQVNFAGPRQRKPILLLGHFDTVYDLGALEKMPWRESKGRLYGPGVFDMKSGIVQMMFALWSLREVDGRRCRVRSKFCWSPMRKRAAPRRAPSPRKLRSSARPSWYASPRVREEH